MRRRFTVRRVTRSIRSFFISPKTNITQERHPERYYKRVWVDQKHYEALVFLAKVNHETQKQMLHEVLERGISDYLAEKIQENNRLEREAREKGQVARATYFIIMLRHWLKSKGEGNISKII